MYLQKKKVDLQGVPTVDMERIRKIENIDITSYKCPNRKKNVDILGKKQTVFPVYRLPGV